MPRPELVALRSAPAREAPGGPPLLAIALLAAAITVGTAACGLTGPGRTVAAARSADLRTARAMLEAEREKHPDSVEVRVTLGELYYRTARAALDRRGDEARYLAYLEQSVEEFLAAAALDPAHDQPHFYLAVMDLYRGDLDAALRGFHNAHRLRPEGFSYTNMGEIFVYRGDLERAREWTLAGLRQGAGAGAVTFNQMLIHWRAGDLRAAERDFDTLWRSYPEMIQTINAAPLPREPQTFDEFADYCCGSPGCGPYLVDACRALGADVVERQLSNEAVLKELRIEAEKERRLREIYQGRKELELEVEP